MPLPPEVRLNTELTALPDAKGEYRKQKAAATSEALTKYRAPVRLLTRVAARYFPGQKPAGLEEENGVARS